MKLAFLPQVPLAEVQISVPFVKLKAFSTVAVFMNSLKWILIDPLTSTILPVGSTLIIVGDVKSSLCVVNCHV